MALRAISPSPESIQCSICLCEIEELDEGMTATKMSCCNGCFHTDCLEQWRKRSKKVSMESERERGGGRGGGYSEIDDSCDFKDAAPSNLSSSLTIPPPTLLAIQFTRRRLARTAAPQCRTAFWKDAPAIHLWLGSQGCSELLPSPRPILSPHRSPLS